MNIPLTWSIVLGILGLTVGIIAVIYLVVPLFKGIGWLVRHILCFIGGVLGDLARSVGHLITAVVYVPLVLLNILIGRWSASRHYGRALQDELVGIGHCLYRVGVGHPARLLGLGGMVEGIEQRVPQAMAQAPGVDKPSKRSGQFDGYTIVGSLQGGGSGGRLYVAEPDERKRAIFARSGRDVKQVVIKTFSMEDGSSLPQIIRESRALEAAKNLGLILDHELTDQRFFYVMEFIPGDSLSVVTKRLHAEAGAEGLGAAGLRSVLGIASDLLTELDRYHTGGLWHKDIKPDNIIINQGRAHVVDLGLITPLRSAMTLTTHGTEYFRDPEMVRMALRGAKVNEVDGVKFDLYGVGAVLFSVIENSFPAHGGLSQITRQCPEALRWIVRRAMTDLHNRYASSAEMAADIRTLMAAPDPFALKPFELPSMREGGAEMPPPIPQAAAVPFPGRAASPVPPAAPAPAPQPAQGRRAPKIAVTDWLTGRYAANEGPGAAAGFGAARAGAGAGAARAGNAAPRGRRAPGMTAQEQINSARARVRTAQARVHMRRTGRAPARFDTKPNFGVALAVVLFLAIGLFLFMRSYRPSGSGSPAAPTVVSSGDSFNVQLDDGPIEISVDGMGSEMERGFAQMGRGFEESGPGSASWNEQWAKFRDSFKDMKKDFAHMGQDMAKGFKEGVHAHADENNNAQFATSGGAVQGQVESIAELNELAERIASVLDRLKRNAVPALPAAKQTGHEPGRVIVAPVPPAPPGLDPHEVEAIKLRAMEQAARAREAAQRSLNEAHRQTQGLHEPGRVLILVSGPESVLEDERERLEQIKTLLEWRWFKVGGLTADDVDTDVLAQAKRVVELSGPDDAEAVERVRRWLENPETKLDAMLWVGQDASGDAVRRMILRPGYDASELRAALSGE